MSKVWKPCADDRRVGRITYLDQYSFIFHLLIYKRISRDLTYTLISTDTDQVMLRKISPKQMMMKAATTSVLARKTPTKIRGTLAKRPIPHMSASTLKMNNLYLPNKNN